MEVFEFAPSPQESVVRPLADRNDWSKWQHEWSFWEFTRNLAASWDSDDAGRQKLGIIKGKAMVSHF